VIPADRSVEGVRAIVESESPVPGQVDVAVAAEALVDGLHLVPMTAGWTEGPVAEFRSEGYLRGWKLAAFVVRPLRYDAVSGRVSLATSIRIEVTLGPSRDAAPVPRVRGR